MTYQKQTTGSLEDSKEVNRTFQVYNEHPRSPTNLKREARERRESQIRAGEYKGISLDEEFAKMLSNLASKRKTMPR